MIVINDNGREMTVGNRGINLEVDGRKKYYIQMHFALKAFGWQAASDLLEGTALEDFKSFCGEIHPNRQRIAWTFDGIAGVYRSTTYPQNRGVILDLVTFTDSHLAKSETTGSTIFPSTHAQAAVRMVVTDIQSKAFKDGAFVSEEELIGFIHERLALVKEAMKTFEVVEGQDDSSEVEEDSSDDDSELDADIGADAA